MQVSVYLLISFDEKKVPLATTLSQYDVIVYPALAFIMLILPVCKKILNVGLIHNKLPDLAHVM
jgi:hypothetical protein